MKKPKFANEEIYHIYNRGVEKRVIFLDDEDRLRFIYGLFQFNDQYPVINTLHRLNNHHIEVEPRYDDQLVEILVFCLMPNHYHLMVRQKSDGGIVQFMKKLGTGYTMYFNQKYQRVGHLFQGRFKAIHVNRDSHLLHLPYYIHLNPLDLIAPEWRKREIKDPKKSLEFLKQYRWSSYLDYIGKENFPAVIRKDFLTELYNGPEGFSADITKWIKEMNLEKIRDVALE